MEWDAKPISQAATEFPLLQISGLRLLKAPHSANPQRVAGLSSGPEHGHEWMTQMTGVADRWTHQWPVTDGVVAVVHRYPGVASHGERYM